MRNIKFRGRTADGEWVYGYFALHHYNNYAIKDGILTKEGETVKALIYNDTRKDQSYWTEVEEESVEEFTGAYDSHGTEIYEGDLVRASYLCRSVLCVVKYTEAEAGFRLHILGTEDTWSISDPEIVTEVINTTSENK